MAKLGLEKDIVDRSVYENTLARLKHAGVRLPTFAELADPNRIPASIRERLSEVDPDSAHPLNLFRVHWHNATDRRGLVGVPEHIVLPKSLTGVDAPILVALGNRFPMIAAHKVLAAYGCLVPRLVTGQFDPTTHLALWPSTGNYCRGGVAISRILGCRGVAILPEDMSAERFRWLERWVTDPRDIVKTPGSESNVKEIYDKCQELDRDPKNVIFNQFCEFGNHLVHYACTGPALARAFQSHSEHKELFAFVSATGSAGTLAAGDYLKDAHGARICAVEALECPTLLYNGFGAHNIQGIGDKHVPYIHHAMNTDLVAGVSDRATDGLGLLFSRKEGLDYLADRRAVPAELLAQLGSIGFSGICNVLAAIKIAKYYDLGPSQCIVTVATDGAAMYGSEHEKALHAQYEGRFDAVTSAEVFGQYMLGNDVGHLSELSHRDRERIHNLGYFTWVEQQGVSLEDFSRRKEPAFWRGLRDLLPAWDAMIERTNAALGESS